MTDTNKLKAKIVENGFTIVSLAVKMKMSKATLSQKVNNKIKCSQDDIKGFTKELNLNSEEIEKIFLS